MKEAVILVVGFLFTTLMQAVTLSPTAYETKEEYKRIQKILKALYLCEAVILALILSWGNVI